MSKGSSAKNSGSGSAAAREKTFQLIVQNFKSHPAYTLVFAVGLISIVLWGVDARFATELQIRLEFWGFALLVAFAIATIVFIERGRAHTASPLHGATENREDLTRFAARIKGDWWQQIIPHPTLYVSHVVIEADPISGQIGMSAKAYDADGNVAATWRSEAAVLIGNKLFYIWSGKYTDEKRSAEQRTGFGSFNFRGEGEVRFGQGEFLDVDMVLQKLETSKWSLAEFKRCEADESAVLNSHDKERIRELIQKKKMLSGAP